MIDEIESDFNPLARNRDHLIKLYEDKNYTAYTEDLDFMWRWTIYRDKQLVQEGCSLTESASGHAVKHVLAYFDTQTINQEKLEVAL